MRTSYLTPIMTHMVFSWGPWFFGLFFGLLFQPFLKDRQPNGYWGFYYLSTLSPLALLLSLVALMICSFLIGILYDYWLKRKSHLTRYSLFTLLITGVSLLPTVLAYNERQGVGDIRLILLLNTPFLLYWGYQLMKRFEHLNSPSLPLQTAFLDDDRAEATVKLSVCPNCLTQIELSAGEVEEKRFQCPKCGCFCILG